MMPSERFTNISLTFMKEGGLWCLFRIKSETRLQQSRNSLYLSIYLFYVCIIMYQH